jgi:Protein of unknown function (DUF1566)/PKD domain
MKNIFFKYVMALVFILPSFAYSQITPNCNNYLDRDQIANLRIFYVNGIMNTQIEANAGTCALGEVIKDLTGNLTPTTLWNPKGIYQGNEPLPSSDNACLYYDATSKTYFKIAKDLLGSVNGSIGSVYNLLGREISCLSIGQDLGELRQSKINEEAYETVYKQNFEIGAQLDYSKTTQAKAIAFIDTYFNRELKIVQDVIDQTADPIINEARAGKNVIVVAHSQGNIIVNLAWVKMVKYLTLDELKRIRIINVANTSLLSPHGSNITHSDDKQIYSFLPALAMKPPRATKFRVLAPTFSANMDISGSNGNHSFTPVYLSGQAVTRVSDSSSTTLANAIYGEFSKHLTSLNTGLTPQAQFERTHSSWGWYYAPATVGFKATASVTNASITSYQWNFGDDTTANGREVSHTYTIPGTYIVSLKANSSTGASTIVQRGFRVLPALTCVAPKVVNASKDNCIDPPITSTPSNPPATAYSPVSTALTPVVTSLSVTNSLPTGAQAALSINGANFKAGNQVRMRWLIPAKNGTNSSRIPTATSASQLTTVFNPGTVNDTIYVRVCTDNTVASACSNEKTITVAAVVTPPITCTAPNTLVNGVCTPPVVNPPTTATGLLPDTGITAAQCYAAGSDTLVSCTSAAAIALNSKQDGMIGRDVTTPSNADGKLGFSYAAVGSYPLTSCVKDTITGLTWEGKEASGTRAGTNLYTNYRGTYGTAAQISAPSNAASYVTAVNAAVLCGFSNWRLPTRSELQSIVDYSVSYTGPTIDSEWFPNTHNYCHTWTSSPYMGFSNGDSIINFRFGDVGGSTAVNPGCVRLVR